MRSLLRPLLVAAALCVPALAATAARHLKLVRSEPTANARLTAAPAQIKLWFSQETQLAVTKVSLVRPDGEPMPLAGLTRGTEKDAPVVAAIPSTLGAGKWTIRWRTVAKDGHPMKGDIPFVIAPPTTR